MRATCFAVAAAVFAAIASPASAQTPSRLLDVEGQFLVSDADEPEKGDLSGIACDSGSRREGWSCLVLSDELPDLQRVALTEATLRPGASIGALSGGTRLVGAAPDTSVYCTPRANPHEFDGEAITMEGGYYYVVGSHGCSRSRHRYDRTSFLVTRFRLDESGAPADIAYSYRLSEALRAEPQIRDYFGKRLMEFRRDDGAFVAERGVNVEGAAMMDGALYVGLRAPSLNGRAFFVGVNAEALFNSDAALEHSVFSAPVGENVGVRDMIAAPGGGFLVLGGPTEEQPTVRYAIYQVAIGGEARVLRVLDPQGADKPEALFVMSSSAARLRVLVLHDGPRDGRPTVYDIDLR